ncbi:MAG: type II toxin-antitoxin system RelE/ParE family toxin [Candidatus Margulisbacteria bacterium]|jgi:addiction module RelE/StbE family toxin|nr:type II toxin-antitoxin system RelE/ParE family toxin [Candidatus Margulisiibacteriota bacterium]
MPYTIQYADSVVREDIPALPKKQKLQIKRAIEERLAADPVGLGKPLRYSLLGHRRLRVGDWWIIYRIEGVTIKIVKIGNRKDVYAS